MLGGISEDLRFNKNGDESSRNTWQELRICNRLVVCELQVAGWKVGVSYGMWRQTIHKLCLSSLTATGVTTWRLDLFQALYPQFNLADVKLGVDMPYSNRKC